MEPFSASIAALQLAEMLAKIGNSAARLGMLRILEQVPWHPASLQHVKTTRPNLMFANQSDKLIFVIDDVTSGLEKEDILTVASLNG